MLTREEGEMFSACLQWFVCARHVQLSFSQTYNMQYWHYWHQRLYYVKGKESSHKMLPPSEDCTHNIAFQV